MNQQVGGRDLFEGRVPQRFAGTAPRIASAGLVDEARRAGPSAARAPASGPMKIPMAIVAGRTSTVPVGMESAPV